MSRTNSTCGKTDCAACSMTEVKNILIKNIYHMLSYAFHALKQTTQEEIEAESFENIHDLLAAILSKGLSRQLKQGLYRTYVVQHDSLPLIRGKVDMQGTMKHLMQQQRILACEFDELSVNNIYNQVIKTTASILLIQPTVSEERRSALKKMLLFLPEVDTINPHSIPWSRLNYQKNNENYKLLLNICYFILDGLLLTTDKGKFKLTGFLDDQKMSRLYERFVLEYYRRHHRDVVVSASQVKWDLDDVQVAALPMMQTDVTLRKNGKTLIIDTKFYSRSLQYNPLFNSRTYHSGNLYQIFTYVKNEDKLRSGNISGLLLYARTQEAAAPDIDFNVGGNRFCVRSLNLNVPFKELAGQLDQVVVDWLAR